MPEDHYYDYRPGAGFRRHLAQWRAEQENIRVRIPQHDGCEAVGSILNNTRKPRWHTKRAGAIMVLASLTGFGVSMAVGGAGVIGVIVALGFGTATVTVYRVEKTRRYQRGISSQPPRPLVPSRAQLLRPRLRMARARLRESEQE